MIRGGVAFERLFQFLDKREGSWNRSARQDPGVNLLTLVANRFPSLMVPHAQGTIATPEDCRQRGLFGSREIAIPFSFVAEEDFIARRNVAGRSYDHDISQGVPECIR